LSANPQVPPDYWAAIDAAAHLARRVVVLTVPTSIIGEPLRQQQGLWQQRNKVWGGAQHDLVAPASIAEDKHVAGTHGVRASDSEFAAGCSRDVVCARLKGHAVSHCCKEIRQSCWGFAELQEIRDWVSKRKDNKVALVDFDKLAWMDHSPPGTHGHNWHYQVQIPQTTTSTK
jgi:hypothetical protein